MYVVMYIQYVHFVSLAEILLNLEKADESCMCVQTLLVALDDSILLYATCVQGQQSNRSSQIHSQDFFLCKFVMEKEYKVVFILT